MKLISGKKGKKINSNETVILFIAEFKSNVPGGSLPAELNHLKEQIDAKYFKGKLNETELIHYKDKPAAILAGIGKEKSLTIEALRNSAAKAISLCRDKNITDITIIVPELKSISETESLKSLSEGIFLSNYNFDKYKTKSKENDKPTVKRAVFLNNVKSPDSILKKIETTCRNTLLCRDLINETSDKCDSKYIASLAKNLIKTPGVSCKVYGLKDIKKMKMGLLLAVNRGSRIPPQLVVLKYNGNPKSKKYFAIVGKGITFDSGGINLKPSGHIEDMRTDMSGAAAALYAFKSVAELKLKKNVYAVMPLTENMITNNSYRPGDIFKSHNGITVEIGNTDAEGRLILADALSFTESQLKPECIVDIATLTGACLAAFGEVVAAYLTTDDKLGGILENAAETTGDRVWKLPYIEDYEDNIKSDIADINNISSEKNAGTIIGAIFLKNFVKKTKWAHIDIAGTARYTKQRGYKPKNATGFGVRLLTETIANWKD